ncbi:MAG: YraN family protein [Oscillospiraceae bacterium]
MTKSDIGKLGEIKAARFLRDDGYNIISCNFHSRLGEIDIIASKDNFIGFIEVKTRDENSMFSPADAVDIKKRKKIIATAQVYLASFSTNFQPRFDIIEVITKNDKIIKINHIKNAYDALGK